MIVNVGGTLPDSAGWDDLATILKAKIKALPITEDVVYNHSINGNTTIRAEYIAEDAAGDVITLDRLVAHVCADDIEAADVAIGRTLTVNSIVYNIREVLGRGDAWAELVLESRV